MKFSLADLADARVLSIRQPWAELILRHRKPIEIRSWTRKYRGLLLIHASGGWDAAAARELGVSKESVTQGAFVGVAWLHDVRRFTKQDARLLKRKGGDNGCGLRRPVVAALDSGPVLFPKGGTRRRRIHTRNVNTVDMPTPGPWRDSNLTPYFSWKISEPRAPHTSAERCTNWRALWMSPARIVTVFLPLDRAG